MSTITLTLTQTGAAPAAPSEPNAISQAFRDAGSYSLDVVTTVIAGAGLVLPLAILAGIAFLVGRAVWRRVEPAEAGREGGRPPRGDGSRLWPMRITYVGHATVLIDMDGVRLLTDPVLRGRVAHLRRRGPVPADALRGVDTVLISHAHMDHLDPPSLAKLGEEMPMVVPRGAGPLLRRKRFRRVIEIDEGADVQDRRA